jgi:hypothetical protein
MAIIIKSALNFGQIVYVKTDTAQDPRQVIGIQGTADGGLLIKLAVDGEVTWHYECEITTDKNILFSMDND